MFSSIQSSSLLQFQTALFFPIYCGYFSRKENVFFFLFYYFILCKEEWTPAVSKGVQEK